MPKTATLDYVVMISGEITVLFEEGNVTLRTGDVFVDRGVYHAWENRGTAWREIVTRSSCGRA